MHFSSISIQRVVQYSSVCAICPWDSMNLSFLMSYSVMQLFDVHDNSLIILISAFSVLQSAPYESKCLICQISYFSKTHFLSLPSSLPFFPLFFSFSFVPFKRRQLKIYLTRYLSLFENKHL